MRVVVSRTDKAVSPIIGTVLLVAITVTLVASMYTILGGYFDGLPQPTPTASLKVVNGTATSNSLVNGSYSLYVTYVSNNISTQQVSVEITMSNGSVFIISLGSVDQASSVNFTVYSGSGGMLTANYTGTPSFLTSYSTITFDEYNNTGYLTRLDLIDTHSDSSLGSVNIIS